MGIDFTGSTLALVIVLFAVGLICIIKGGDLFVDAATWIAEASGIPKFIIGATVVSFRNDHARNARLRVLCIRGQRRYRSRQRRRLGHGEHGLIMCLSLVCMSCYMTRKSSSASRPVCCLRRSCCCLLSRATVRCRFREHYHHARFSSALWSRASLPQSASREARRPTSARAPTARALR